MIIDGFNKLTLLDYPGLTACIIFTRGCNFNCNFCQNSSLIKINKKQGLISEQEVLSYLTKRKSVLDGIVISGGEPTIQKGLIEFIKKVKKIGLKVKLDTNGYNPEVLQYLIDNRLVDYIAMDIKHIFANYAKIIKKNIGVDKIKQSIELLKKSQIDHEFRTTIIKEYHHLDDLINIIAFIGKKEKYYLQNFVDSEDVNCRGLHGFTDEELISLENTLRKYSKNINIRGIVNDNSLKKEREKCYV